VIALPDDLSGIIDKIGGSDLPAGVGGQAGIEVDHGVVLPKEAARLAIGIGRDADDLTMIVEGPGRAEMPTERTEVDDVPVAEQHGVKFRVSEKGGIADDLSGVIDAVGAAEGAAERAQIMHLAVAVEECMPVDFARERRITGDVACIVEGAGGAVSAAQGAEIVHDPIAEEEGVGFRISQGGGIARDLAEVIDGAARTGRAAERAEVLQGAAVLAEEGMRIETQGGKRGIASGVPGIADGTGGTHAAAQGAEVEERVADGEESMELRIADAGGVADDLTEIVEGIADAGGPAERAQVDTISVRPAKSPLFRGGRNAIAGHVTVVVLGSDRERRGAGNGDVRDGEALRESGRRCCQQHGERGRFQEWGRGGHNNLPFRPPLSRLGSNFSILIGRARFL